jgi:hypothetical protein
VKEGSASGVYNSNFLETAIVMPGKKIDAGKQIVGWLSKGE